MFSFEQKGSEKPVAEIIGNKKSRYGHLVGEYVYLHRKKNGSHFDENNYFDNFTLPPELHFKWLPDSRPNFTDCLAISAPRGQGKSTLASYMAETIKDCLNLTKDDIIVAKKSTIEDPAYKNLDPQYIYIDDSFLENPVTCDEIASDGKCKVVICDDLDTINSPSLKKATVKFVNQLLEEGRKYGIYTIIAQHHMAQGKDTKSIISESTYFVFFPEGTTSDFTYMLSKYADMDKNIIKDLKKSNSRWVMYHQHAPRFILTENNIRIYDHDKEIERIETEKLKKKEQRKKKVSESLY